MKMIPIKIGKKNLYLNFETYENNNSVAVEIYCKSGGSYEPYLTLTTNGGDHIDILLDSNECLVKTWSENESIINDLLKTGYFKDTGKRIQMSQWCEASIWEIIKRD